MNMWNKNLGREAEESALLWDTVHSSPPAFGIPHNNNNNTNKYISILFGTGNSFRASVDSGGEGRVLAFLNINKTLQSRWEVKMQ